MPTANLSKPASCKIDDEVESMQPFPAASERVTHILNPTAESKQDAFQRTPRSGRLEGVVGFLDISKAGGSVLLDRLAQLFQEQFPAVTVKRFMKATFSRPMAKVRDLCSPMLSCWIPLTRSTCTWFQQTLQDEITATCQFVVSALAD
jgi:hypothetical protein